MSQEMIEKSFPVTAPARLKLSNIRGSVQIEAGTEEEIFVRAVKVPNTGDVRRTEIVLSQSENGEVRVETRYTDWFLSILNFSAPCKVDYLVRVPPTCDMEVSVVSSSLSVQGVTGDITLKTVSGDAKLDELDGSLRLSSVSGDIQGEKLSGKLNLNTVSGNVRLQDGALKECHATTVSGDIHIDTSEVQGPYSFQSVSGDVFVKTSQPAGFSVKFHTVSGDLRTALPLKHLQKGVGWLTAEVNGGGADITAKSVSGNITLEGVEIKASEASMNSTRLSRIEVLERIERGEMTVEEGLAHLR